MRGMGDCVNEERREILRNVIKFAVDELKGAPMRLLGWIFSEEFVMGVFLIVLLSAVGAWVYFVISIATPKPTPAPYLEACGRAIQAEYGNGPLGAKMFDELCNGQWKEGE